MRHLSPWVFCEGNLEGCSFTGYPEGYVEGSGGRHPFHRGPTGEPGRGLHLPGTFNLFRISI